MRRAGAFVAVLLGLALTDAPASARQDTTPLSLDGAAEAGEALPRLHSLLVSHRGELVLERYFNGTRATRPANIKSVSKSVISALVGIAIEQGHIRSVEQPIADFLPELADGRRARKRAITHRGSADDAVGTRVDEQPQLRRVGDEPQLGARRAPSPAARTRRARAWSTAREARTCCRRSSRGRRSKSTWQFAQEALARPLGFSLARWPRDPQGIYFGGNDMLMTPRQMVAFGELYLQRGRRGRHGRSCRRRGSMRRSCRAGRSRWAATSCTATAGGFASSPAITAFYAWGYGGQFIFVVPDARSRRRPRPRSRTPARTARATTARSTTSSKPTSSR